MRPTGLSRTELSPVLVAGECGSTDILLSDELDQSLRGRLVAAVRQVKQGGQRLVESCRRHDRARSCLTQAARMARNLEWELELGWEDALPRHIC